MPSHNSREAIEAEIPDEHRAFVNNLIEEYAVPDATEPGMRTRFIRSKEIEDQQLEAVLSSEVNMLACGIGAPPKVIAEAKRLNKTTLALIGSPHHAESARSRGGDTGRAGYDAGAHTARSGPIRWYLKLWTQQETPPFLWLEAWQLGGISPQG